MNRRHVFFLAFLVLVGLVIATPLLLGFRRINPIASPASTLDDADLAHSLQYVSDGVVDYGALSRDRTRLDRYVATLATVGPESNPVTYRTNEAKLTYYINAYNALVLYAVVRAGRISSVQDVQGTIEPQAGFGFFYGQHFLVDGSHTNLYDLENDKIRAFADPRIHAVLNCASKSCPPLSSTPYRVDNFHSELGAAMRAFCAPPNVQIDHEARVLRLSAIFDWYSGDFIGEARRQAWGETLLDYLANCGDEDLRGELERARNERYVIEYLPYDWSLNGSF